MKKFDKEIARRYFSTLTDEQKENAFCEMAHFLYVGDEIDAYEDDDGLRVFWSHTEDKLGE